MTNILEGGELRDATVLFCDLGGYTAWNEEEDPESVVAVMDRIKLQAIRIFEEHGGVANQFVGDEILGLFGVSSSHEDDPCRAISAALELHAYVRAQQVHRADGTRRMLELHTGIETGSVYVRVTDSRAGLFDVTGDTVNTAARLRALAESGTILIGPATFDAASALFELSALEPALLRGKAAPVTAYAVLGRTRTSGSWAADYSRRAQSIYVGRERELAHIVERWERAQAGDAGLLTIEGSAGIGKSRLVHELRKRVEADALVLHGRCSAYRAAPYEPFLEAMVSCAGSPELVIAWLSSIDGLSATSRAALAALLVPNLRPDAELAGEKLRVATGDALHELIVSLARIRPVLLVLEDFHDADELSRATIERMLPALAGVPVLVVLTFRPLESAAPLRSLADTLVALDVLDGARTRSLACSVLTATTLHPELADYIHERSLGNPFFVEEICRSLVEAGAITRRFGYVVPARKLELARAPRSVLSIVRARIERLAGDQKKLLRLASVLGLEFEVASLGVLWTSTRPARSTLVSESAWRALHPPESVERIPGLLAELEQQGLVLAVSETSFRFHHAITRELAYESLPRQERRWYHGLIATWTEQTYEGAAAHYETLAHHYGLSANATKALDYALLSGEKAWQAFALEQASAHFGAAIAVFDTLGELEDTQRKRYIATAVSWARVGLYNPHARQLTALAAALHHARALGDARRACVCLNWTSWIEYALGNQAAAVVSSEAFLTAARALGDAGFEAQALANAGLAFVLSSEYERAVTLIRASIDRRGRSDGTAYAYSLGYLAMVAGDQGQFARAEAYLDEAWQLVHASGRESLHGPALIQRGMVQAWRGEWDACLITAAHASEVAGRIGGRYIRAMSLVLQGYALGMASSAQRTRGIELLQQGITTLEALGIRLHLSWCLSCLAELLLHDDAPRAREVTELALQRVAENDRLGECAALRVSALAGFALEGDLEEAERRMERALKAALAKASPRDEALTQLSLGWLRQRAGHHDAARVGAARARHDLRTLQMPFFDRLADQLLEALG